LKPASIAIVHDWFTIYTGSERVVEQMLGLYPQADLFSLVDFVPDDQRAFLKGKPVQTTFIQHMPFARSKYRQYLPLMPLAIEQLDVSKYDLVISSNHAIGKGVLTGPDQLHVSYINSPIRYAWDMQHEYLREAGLEHGLKSWVTRMLLHYIRLWDTRTILGVDAIAANSGFIARRIWKVYRRESRVIYPPVDVERFRVQTQKEDFYLAASRLVPYKKMELIVNAFSGMPDLKLVVVGDGPDLARVQKAAGPNVKVMGYQSDEALADLLGRAKAYVFAAQEDFGILPVEAQAAGTPVIAYGRGGAAETVRGLEHERPSGLFFTEQTVESIRAAVRQFEQAQACFDPQNCRANAEQFKPERFNREFTDFVDQAWDEFQRRLKG
jgi:glycosyltransferase involved in cell wall biosynthesis